ncbi:MAG: bifunctional phosphoribosylaminoimidazolecarboxamide formyltransferase/IMP cyclohydrolase [Planctomycetota bacterium]|nr:bifunctional phosphoribosylaminoimidazolecarboxamide formyltransferase/IMP cyclohydrolase [Planctomycetota bacterium]
MPRALLSVSDKTGLASFAKSLVDLGFELVSTGGTRRHLEESGLPVIDVAGVTGFPEMMDGRVKTLHPLVHGGILGRPDLASDAAAMKQHGILPFQIVICNLYPFEQTVAKPGVSADEAIEQIDVGGPSMVRAAAKNHAHVAIVTDPSQYDEVLEAIRSGGLDEGLRRRLAASAFALTARYDAAIADYMAKLVASSSEASDAQSNPFPSQLALRFSKRSDLRYGENPHQAAAFYVDPKTDDTTLAAAEQQHGKELSYNNLLDLDAALRLVRDLATHSNAPAVAVLKHNNPCGCAVGVSVADAFEKAWSGDPVSAFGSILGFSHPLDVATAEALCQPNRFVEAILAPEFDADALKLLTTKPSWRANVRLMRLPSITSPTVRSLDYRKVSGGMLVQDLDEGTAAFETWQTVTRRQPTAQEFADLRFAWLVCKHVKSNAIVFVKDGMTTGVGAGQMSRVDSSLIASRKSEGRCVGGVCASDAFFPFRDGVDHAAAAGIKAIVQPGGSKRDDESIAACDEHGIAMLFTGRRHFRH